MVSTKLLLSYGGHSQGNVSRLALFGAEGGGGGFFRAPLRDPQLFRLGLLTLGRVVQANLELLSLEEWEERIALDPVVGVHPDGLSFEGFSQDGSTLGWVHFEEKVFGPPEMVIPGCTNIDYSSALDRYLRSLTAASRIQLCVGTGEGMAVEDAWSGHHEKQIDLPDNWRSGFGELHAGLLQTEMRIPLTRAELHNLIRFFHQRRDVKGEKRALLFELAPGERVSIRLEPWDTRFRLQAETPDDLAEAREVRVYGRRRLLLIEQLLPWVESAAVHLTNDTAPRPSYWQLNLRGGGRFILGLSSWTGRKFTASSSERLRGAWAPVAEEVIGRAAGHLADCHSCTVEALAQALELSASEGAATALALCRRGLAVSEPESRVLRWRPLTHLLPPESAAAGTETSREHNAAALHKEGSVRINSVARREGLVMAEGLCTGSTGTTYTVSFSLGPDGSFAAADCTCAWMKRQRGTLTGGPCKHLLALRMAVLQCEKSEIG